MRALENLGLHELVVGGELLLELGVGLGVALDLVLLEQLADAGDVGGAVRQLLLDFFLDRPEQPRRHALADPRLGQLRERLVAFLHPGVAAQAHQRRFPPLRRHLIVEQHAHALEHRARRAEERHHQLVVELRPLHVLLGGVDQDLEVLLDQRVLLAGEALLQGRDRLSPGSQRAILVARGEIADRLVVAGDPEPGGALRPEAGHDVEEHLGVRVAALDPLGRCGGRGGRRPGKGSGG